METRGCQGPKSYIFYLVCVNLLPVCTDFSHVIVSEHFALELWTPRLLRDNKWQY